MAESSSNDEQVIKEPVDKLNTDTSTWEGMLNSFLIWAAQDPWTFLYYVLLGLSPFFAVSAFLSYKLSKAIDKQEKAHQKRRKSPRKTQKAD